jgi:hypothetical protein
MNAGFDIVMELATCSPACPVGESKRGRAQSVIGKALSKAPSCGLSTTNASSTSWRQADSERGRVRERRG